MRHGLEHMQGFVRHAGFGVGFEESEGHVLWEGVANGSDDAWHVGEKEGGIGCHVMEGADFSALRSLRRWWGERHLGISTMTPDSGEWGVSKFHYIAFDCW